MIKSVGVLGQKAWVFGLRAVPLVSAHSAPTSTMFLTSSPLCQKERMQITNFQDDQYTISSGITFNFDSTTRWHDNHRGTGQGGSLSLQQAHKARPCARVHSQHTGLPCRHVPLRTGVCVTNLMADVLGNKLIQEPDANICHLHQSPGARHSC